ncbi:MAG: CPBP family intramembrane metalloprotease [Clostridiales bacterium]|jgi:membrane protease YdiL (CAAX protease family)|nr:CPBP family intramembrane metalloprotease [Clostridiales bacterium]
MKRKALTFGESNVSIITAFAGSIAGATIIAGLVMIANAFNGGSFAESTDFAYITLALTQLLMFGGAFFYLAVLRKVNVFNLFRMGFGKLSLVKVLLLFAIAVGAILLFAPLAELFVGALMKLGYQPIIEEAESFTWGGLVIAIAAMCILPAFNEEILFRGILMNGARRKGAYFAIVYTAFIFMIFHGNPQQTVHQFFLGLIFGYLAVTTGSIIFGVILHFFNNLIAVLFGYISFDGITSDGLIIMYAVWVVAGAVILFFALRAFKRLNDREKFGDTETKPNGIKDSVVYIKKLLFDKSFRLTEKEAFNNKYDAQNEFGGEIDPDVIFAAGTGEEKKYPTSAKVAIIGGILMWLLTCIMGFLGALS